jgi:hypothetical protein
MIPMPTYATLGNSNAPYFNGGMALIGMSVAVFGYGVQFG